MALSKSVTLTNGTVAAYWSIISMQAVLPPTSRVNVYLGGFASSAYAASGNPLVTRFFQFTTTDLGVTDITTATQAEVYAAILKQVNATGSTDPLAGATSE